MKRSEEVLTAILNRRSVRDFKKGKLQPADLEKILEVGTMAPSPGNSQPWRFHVITGKTKKDLVEELNSRKDQQTSQYYAKIIGEASTILAVENFAVHNMRRVSSLASSLRLDDPQQAVIGSYLGTAASTENMLIAIHALGYGSVWIGRPFVLEATRKVIRNGGVLTGILPIGCPSDQIDEHGNRSRRSVDEVTKYYE